MTSLYLARTLTTFLWSRGKDPDVYALPVHSALMDLVGQVLLVTCFEVVSVLGGRVGMGGEGG
jgi:solute carrier family 41